MRLQWLYYFDVISDLEHYTKASEQLHMSQSALSHAMKELEEELGTKLFEPSGRNIRLTKSGIVFRGFVRQIISTLETGMQTVRELNQPHNE